MRVLALYVKQDLMMIRRVVAPFNVLATRGYSFAFQQVVSFEPGLAFGHDITILPNWVLREEELPTYLEVAQQRTFVYDLSDPSLLENEQVRRTLGGAKLVTVPNEYLQKEVRALPGVSQSKVMVTPSTIDPPYFARAHRNDTLFSKDTTVIGCFGPHDWELVKPALTALREKRPQVQVIGDKGAHEVLGDLVHAMELTVTSYPDLLKSCTFGLCPREGYTGHDTIWALEYGILCKPVIASADSYYSRVLGKQAAQLVPSKNADRWCDAILLWNRDLQMRARAGQCAFGVANGQRATQVAKHHHQVYDKMLPQVAAMV